MGMVDILMIIGSFIVGACACFALLVYMGVI